ncbi:MAG: XdhC/CoxI family protein [Chloroflexota bacterium]
MQDVIEAALQTVEKGESGVIATVIRTSGSTPQKPGARLLIRRDGSTVGTLGGGCVEGNVWHSAKELMEQGRGPEYREYFLNEELAAQDGLVCGGTMHFFLDPAQDREDFLACAGEIRKACEGGSPVVLAMLVKSAPGGKPAGARLLIRKDGSTIGSLGSDALETMAKETAPRLADYGKKQLLTDENGNEIFLEGFTTPPTLVVMGAGHISKALTSFAGMVGFRIYIVDEHPQFATAERFPEAEGVVLASFSEGLSQVPVNRNTFIVVATRGHRDDDIAVEAALRTPAAYVGLIGSKRKTLLIHESLRQRGVPPERIREIHAPIGLSIGAVTPEEIAVSILAEMLMCRLGGDGKTMKLEKKAGATD